MSTSFYYFQPQAWLPSAREKENVELVQQLYGVIAPGNQAIIADGEEYIGLLEQRFLWMVERWQQTTGAGWQQTFRKLNAGIWGLPAQMANEYAIRFSDRYSKNELIKELLARPERGFGPGPLRKQFCWAVTSQFPVRIEMNRERKQVALQLMEQTTLMNWLQAYIKLKTRAWMEVNL